MANCLGLYIEEHLIKYAKVSKDHNNVKVESFGIKFYDKISLQLNDSYQEIVDKYKSLGFYYNLENPVYVELTDKTGDIIICISKTNSFIDFSVKITNVLRVVY